MIGPKITVYFDTERSYLSVAHLVRSETNPTGTVVRVRCKSFKDVQDGFFNLKKGKLLSEDDMKNLGAVALDTVSNLATVTRRDIIKVTSGNQEFDLWGQRDSLFPQQRDWGSMTDLIGRLLYLMASFCEDMGIPFFILAHERLAADELTGVKKGGPDLNAALYADIHENSDYLWRVWKEEQAVKLNAKGQPVTGTSPGTTYDKGTHFLRFETSESKATKKRTPPFVTERFPESIPNPNLPTMIDKLGEFRPNVATIFGPPGSGKTTFATSLSDPQYFKTEEKKAS